MALLTAQQVGITGTTLAYSAVTASDTFIPDSRVFLLVKNTSGSADTCTVVVPGATFGQNNPDVAVTVPATNGEVLIGPFGNTAYPDPATGLITVTHSQTTGVTSALVRV